MADAEKTLLEVLRSIAREQDYQDPQVRVEPITSDGANYTSKLFVATVASPGKENLNLFAKVGSFSEKIRAQVNADRLFRTENIVYTKLVKLCDSLQEKYQVPQEQRYVFPKYYGGSLKTGSETVVLENLTTVGYTTHDRLKSVDWEHASKSVEALAKFHALSIILEKEDPEEFASLSEKLQFEVMPEDDSVKGVWSQMFGRALQVLDEALREKVANYLGNCDIRKTYIDYHAPRRSRPVLVHGDYRPSNLLYRRQNRKVEALPIDYQTVYTGCPVSDLIYFVVTGTDEEFRRQYYQRLVDHYHDQLASALELYHLNVEEYYPRKDFDSELKELLPYALVLGVMLLPVVTVSAESAPRMDAAAAGLDSFVVEPNRLFAERLGGLVRDLVRWEVI